MSGRRGITRRTRGWIHERLVVSSRSPLSPPLRLPLAMTLVAAAACGSTDARFTSRFAPGFAGAHHVVSVLGVYRDGQMSADAWNFVGPKISPSLGATTCEAAYAFALVSSNSVLSSAIDDYARSSGPTEALLEQLAPAAKGDLILVVTLAGKVPTRSIDAEPSRPAPSTPMMGGRGGTGGGGGGAHGAGIMREGSQARAAPGTNALQMSASLYSVREKRSVALVAMEYTGESADQAIAQFAGKLAEALPATKCAGWSWDAKVDAEHIRQSISE